jgi:hypothetical protein
MGRMGVYAWMGVKGSTNIAARRKFWVLESKGAEESVHVGISGCPKPPGEVSEIIWRGSVLSGNGWSVKYVWILEKSVTPVSLLISQ